MLRAGALHAKLHADDTLKWVTVSSSASCARNSEGVARSWGGRLGAGVSDWGWLIGGGWLRVIA
jgi:hypothetical protein